MVGGGFTGLSAALALAKQGASVVVLEAGKVVGAASGRNGGHVNNGTAHDFSGLAARLGLDHARSLYHAHDSAVDTVERIVEQEQIRCDLRRCGKIKLAARPGIVDVTADRLPRASEHQRMHYVMGYSGHGAQMSVHMGQMMARVLGGDAAANPFRKLDWLAVPGHFGRPWFMPLVGIYYRLKDRLT